MSRCSHTHLFWPRKRTQHTNVLLLRGGCVLYNHRNLVQPWNEALEGFTRPRVQTPTKSRLSMRICQLTTGNLEPLRRMPLLDFRERGIHLGCESHTSCRCSVFPSLGIPGKELDRALHLSGYKQAFFLPPLCSSASPTKFNSESYREREPPCKREFDGNRPLLATSLMSCPVPAAVQIHVRALSPSPKFTPSSDVTDTTSESRRG